MIGDLEAALRQVIRDEVESGVRRALRSLPEEALALSPAGAGEMLSLSAGAVRKLVRDGVLPSLDLGATNRVLIPRHAVVAFARGELGAGEVVALAG